MNDLDTMDYLMLVVGVLFNSLALFLFSIKFDSVLFLFFGIGMVTIYAGLTKGFSKSLKRFVN